MKKMAYLFLIVLLLTLGLLATACSGEVSFTTAKLSEGTMALGIDDDTKPVNPTNVFSPETEEIFCSVKLSNAPQDTEVNSKWIYIQGELEDTENYEIDSYAVTTDGTQYLQFSMSRPANGFPRGEYKLVLAIDGKEELNLPFTVE